MTKTRGYNLMRQQGVEVTNTEITGLYICGGMARQRLWPSNGSSLIQTQSHHHVAMSIGVGLLFIHGTCTLIQLESFKGCIEGKPLTRWCQKHPQRLYVRSRSIPQMQLMLWFPSTEGGTDKEEDKEGFLIRASSTFIIWMVLP